MNEAFERKENIILCLRTARARSQKYSTYLKNKKINKIFHFGPLLINIDCKNMVFYFLDKNSTSEIGPHKVKQSHNWHSFTISFDMKKIMSLVQNATFLKYNFGTKVIHLRQKPITITVVKKYI